MRKLVLIAVLICTSITFAQQGINYKALIKDANNAVVANQSITVQFTILQGVAQTNVYQETHTPTTDANGIVIINIGEGTVVSGVFDTIDWASDDHFLNTQINTGSGLVDMGTTGFKTVPYALSAKAAANVTGLQYLDETNDATDNGGLVKVGRDPANYGSVGRNAVDLSNSEFTSSTYGATGGRSTAMGVDTEASGNISTAMGVGTEASGNISTAMGQNTTASGNQSTAMGFRTEASGIYSTAMGDETTASGSRSTAMGDETTASGFASTAMGVRTLAEARASTAIGEYNVGGGNPTSNVSTDPVFEIGNGTSNSNRNNALTVLKNGTITAPSFDLSEITDDKALVTKEYVDGPSTTQSFSFNTGYDNYGGGFVNPSYYIHDGRVYLEGLVDISAPPGTVIATLPAGYRPSGSLLFNQMGSGFQNVRVDIKANGDVQIVSTGTYNFVSLSGMSFKLP